MFKEMQNKNGKLDFVSQQPQSGWKYTDPSAAFNYWSGLETLAPLDRLLVRQKVDLFEVFTGFERNNKYTVLTSNGEKIFLALEDNNCCSRSCCGPSRSFNVKILDNFKNETIHLYRPLACQGCCFPCCLQTIEVFSPPGTLIGFVKENWAICGSKFSIKNENGDTVLKIKAPCCPISCCSNVDFVITSADGTKPLGKISKQWAGLAKELFTDADYFGISFPRDLDVKIKATVLGACFLIDYMFFEDSGYC